MSENGAKKSNNKESMQSKETKQEELKDEELNNEEDGEEEENQENEEENNPADDAKEGMNDAKEASKIAASAASGNYAKAAVDGIKMAARKLKDKKFRKKLIKMIIMKSIPIILMLVLAAALFGVFNAMKDKMIDLIGAAYSKATGFLSKAWKSITNDNWVDIGEKFEYVVDLNTGETLGTPETIKDRYTDENGKTVDSNGNEYDENGNMLDKNGKVRETLTKEYTLVDQYVRELANKGISIKELKLLGNADYGDKTVEELLEDEESKELIEKYIAEFIRADIITQQPHRNNTANLVNPNDQNKVDGGIYFYRNKKEAELKDDEFNNGTMNDPSIEVKNEDYKQMEYISPEDFLEELGKTDTTLEELIKGEVITTNSSKIWRDLRYKYTIDPETEKLVVLEAKLTKTKEAEYTSDFLTEIFDWWSRIEIKSEEYEIKVQGFDYKELVSKYSMPYEFLINLCEITQNPEFVYHVALLARNTKICLAIQDNVDQIIEVEDTEKDEEKWEAEESSKGDFSLATCVATESPHEKARKMKTVITYTPTLRPYSADTWSFYEDYKYTKKIEGTVDDGNLITTRIPYPERLNETRPDVQILGSGDTQRVIEKIVYSEWVTTVVRTQTKTITSSIKYDEAQICQSIEKSKQFLGLLRNDTGKCEYDCANDVVSKRYNPTALKCAEEAEFNRNGKNVKYKLPNSTVEEAPLNKLESGLQMLYALLQSNSTGYNEKDKMYNSIEEKVDKEEESLSNANYKDAYVIKMQGLVEHLQYLMTFPENEEYDPKTIEDSEVEEIITEDDENINYNVSQGTVASAREIYEYLISKGFTPESACGILGNIEQESYFYTSATNGTHFGLCQWDPERFAGLSELATDRSKKWTDLQVQLDFLWSELEGKMSNVKAEIIGSADMYHATDIFCRKYEICGNYNIEVPRRYKKAQKWYNILVLGKGTSSNGNKQEATGKLKDIFPNGLPQTKEEIEKYLVNVSVPITTKSGVKTTKTVKLHIAIAEDVRKALQEAQDKGFKVYEVQGYNWRNVAGSKTRSQHSYGLAVDINVTENCQMKNGKVTAGSFWEPGKNEYSIPEDGVLVKAFNSIGWGWGGNFSSSKDYMHFSYTGK